MKEREGPKLKVTWFAFLLNNREVPVSSLV
jgi:hypothetical protein